MESGCGLVELVRSLLEFLGANDREQEIHDEQERDDAYNDVSHGM